MDGRSGLNEADAPLLLGRRAEAAFTDERTKVEKCGQGWPRVDDPKIVPRGDLASSQAAAIPDGSHKKSGRRFRRPL